RRRRGNADRAGWDLPDAPQAPRGPGPRAQRSARPARWWRAELDGHVPAAPHAGAPTVGPAAPVPDLRRQHEEVPEPGPRRAPRRARQGDRGQARDAVRADRRLAARWPGARVVDRERSGSTPLQANHRGLLPHDGGVLMKAIARRPITRRPIDGAYRSWSD